ncbi:Type I restriction modification system, N-6 DNA Methylase (fragment) [Microcystis aeruginosa PCC 9806]|uniref:Type I restriction modification system, N-6 DNA Methylase n=1 Tax=Microcystis aeruginosa PCC 9806 TaxID=1160282 RepID=I4H1G1_MICAE
MKDAKLFNSNLDVIDEAFEYLINQSSKGEKGQFFTPRYVIDMCVKMLNPQEDEYMIDTAAGSSGFPVHTIFHVWRQILEDEGLEASHLFSLEEKPPRCKEYVEEKVFAIDFDEKAVRVARTLNLIAGDGQTNVLHLNTLDYELWDEVTKEDDWQNVYFAGFNRLKKLRPKGSKDYREFQFDILMANPPFAGDIKETRMIARYDLAKKPNGKWETKVGRDILFIERNLDFLKPGGRMAIVLPQGRFNNSSDKNIRDFIAERCRILAVVGLHGNTFKPHTGTKTSVLLVQKWNDDPKIGALCPRQDDYNIFFATMQKSGKDNSGEKVYVKVSDDLGDFLLDKHNHWIVDHDLFNHDGLTEDGIAEAFIEFAKKENLSFFDLSPLSKGGAFDAVKYQQLMDRIEAVELLFSKAKFNNESFRVDAEFFQKEYMNVVQVLDSVETQSLFQVATKIDVGHVGSMVSEYDESGILLLQTRNIDEFFVNIDNCQKITQKFHQKLRKSQIKKGNILIARSGSFGKASIYLDSAVVNSADIIIVESKKDKVNPFYLVSFLNSKLGTSQLFRFASGGLQGHVNLTILENLLIPILKSDFQDFLELLINLSYHNLIKAKEIYQQAEDLLLTELGLKDWKPTEESIAVKSFSESFLSSGRLDAEYYQPKYDEIETTIMKYGFIELIKISKNVSTGFTYDSADFVDNGIDIIRINNITQYGLDLSNSVKISPDNSSLRLKDKVAPGAILISMSGSIGLCCCIQDEINAFINQRIMKLYPVDFDGNVLAMIINSVIGKMQLHRVGTGGVQTNLSNSDILNLKIPKLPVSVQQSMSQSINKSLNFRQKSKQLLEIAKIGVEKAIETEEETATAWINQQLESLGVKLI